MRIRIHSCHPLPEIRAWYHLALPNNPTNDLNNTIASTTATSTALVVAVSGFAGHQRTISDLKELLCTDLPALREAGIQGVDLSLQLEGFDLPDGQPLPIVRDNDLIQIVPARGPVKVEELLLQQKKAQEARLPLLEHQGRAEEPGKRVIGTGHGGEGDMQIDPPPAVPPAASHSTSKKRKRSPGPSKSVSTPVQRSKSLSQYAATPRVPPPRSKRQPTSAKESSSSSSSDSSSSSSESNSDEDSDSDSSEDADTKKDEKDKAREKVDKGAESDASSSSARSEDSSSSLTPLSESSSSSSYSPTKRLRKSPVKTNTKAKAIPQVRSGPAKATRLATRATAASSSPITTTKTLPAGPLTAISNASSATLANTPLSLTQSQTLTSLPSSFQSRHLQPSQLQSQQQTHHVPPGHGNAQTQSRNIRRRKKKFIDKSQAEDEHTAIGQVGQAEVGVEVDRQSEPLPSKVQPDITMVDGDALKTTTESVAAATHAPPTTSVPFQIQSAPVAPPASSAIPMSSPQSLSAPPPISSSTLNTTPATSTSASHATPSLTPIPKHVSSSNAQPLGSASTSRRTRRDRHGPAGDVALALNSAFGSNDLEGVLGPDMDVDEDEEEEEEEEEVPARKTGKKGTSASAKRGSGTKPTPKKGEPSQVDGTPTTSVAAMASQPREVMMASLGNKNKKRGYKKQLNVDVPAKIVFSSEGVPMTVRPTPSDGMVDSPMAGPTSGAGAVATTTASAPIASARLIPPSERQERGQLPMNMFVTSVDVEEGLGERKRKKRRKGDEYDYGYAYGGRRALRSRTKKLALLEGQYDDAVEEVTLDYGVGEDGVDGGASKVCGFEWQEAEKGWEMYRVVEKVDELCVGGLFGWKGLGMNPETFLPEQLLIVARVLSVHPENTGTGPGCRVVVRQLLRPGAKAVNFSSVRLRGVIGGEEIGGESQQVEEGEEEESFEWKDVISAGWRCVRTAVDGN
ncbi:hypothetical protein BDN72DRAFT_899638 [Pluteus cervinus]|uniref:Uncharacterized protein n=1 Tax=Pluteus cervinus TaxID=181527 RepID=A0ACD3AMA2_9AGAR|nr:hypothetical protein BDN72DRAFT_899638 [Pluteus cervinus]